MFRIRDRREVLGPVNRFRSDRGSLRELSDSRAHAGVSQTVVPKIGQIAQPSECGGAKFGHRLSSGFWDFPNRGSPPGRWRNSSSAEAESQAEESRGLRAQPLIVEPASATPGRASCKVSAPGVS